MTGDSKINLYIAYLRLSNCQSIYESVLRVLLRMMYALRLCKRIQHHSVILNDDLQHECIPCNSFYLRIECILLKFHWGMKAFTEVHFQ